MAIATERATITSQQFGKSGLKVADLVIPLVALVVFMLISIFVYLPMITDALDMREEMKDVKSKEDDLQVKLTDIETLAADSAQLKYDLDISKRVIPTSLEVSDFSYYVDKVATDSGLDLKEISSGDIAVRNVGYIETREVDDNVFGVSGPIVYQGEYLEIVEFLDQLRVRLPYVVEVSNLEMAGLDSDDDNDWTIELTVTGYYIEDVTGDINVYQPFTSYLRFEDMITTFNEKTQIFNASEN